jgi:hypothetical protein
MTTELAALVPEIEAFFRKMGGWPTRVKIDSRVQPKLTVTVCFEGAPLREYTDRYKAVDPFTSLDKKKGSAQ